MDVAENTIPLIEVLQGLMDRLTSPDLTLDEANRLRPRLMDLLATLGGDEEARSAHGDPPHREASPSVSHAGSNRARHKEREWVAPCPAEPRSVR